MIEIILECIATGSSGNCYILQADNGERLVLDAGISISRLKQAIDFDIKTLRGCLITHHHKDHARCVDELERIGAYVYMPYDIENPKTLKKNYLGGFSVSSFPLDNNNGSFCHTDADGTECPCYGYMIEHEEMGKMLYITDTQYVKWRFKGINHILLGVNYDKEIVDENDTKRSHIYRGHMSIETACRFVSVTDSKCLRSVIMCHLSKSNGDGDNFIARMEKCVKTANVDVAEAGKKWRLRNNNCPF